MLVVYLNYVKSKFCIDDPDYCAKQIKLLNGEGLFWQKVPVKLLRIVEGVEIWLTVSLFMFIEKSKLCFDF